MRIQSEAWYIVQLKTVKQSTWHVTWCPGNNFPQKASQYCLQMFRGVQAKYDEVQWSCNTMQFLFQIVTSTTSEGTRVGDDAGKLRVDPSC